MPECPSNFAACSIVSRYADESKIAGVTPGSGTLSSARELGEPPSILLPVTQKPSPLWQKPEAKFIRGYRETSDEVEEGLQTLGKSPIPTISLLSEGRGAITGKYPATSNGHADHLSVCHLVETRGQGCRKFQYVDSPLSRELQESGKTGVTPLQRAASEGHLEIVELLLKHSADVARQDNATPCTPVIAMPSALLGNDTRDQYNSRYQSNFFRSLLEHRVSSRTDSSAHGDISNGRAIITIIEETNGGRAMLDQHSTTGDSLIRNIRFRVSTKERLGPSKLATGKDRMNGIFMIVWNASEERKAPECLGYVAHRVRGYGKCVIEEENLKMKEDRVYGLNGGTRPVRGQSCCLDFTLSLLARNKIYVLESIPSSISVYCRSGPYPYIYNTFVVALPISGRRIFFCGGPVTQICVLNKIFSNCAVLTLLQINRQANRAWLPWDALPAGLQKPNERAGLETVVMLDAYNPSRTLCELNCEKGVRWRWKIGRGKVRRFFKHSGSSRESVNRYMDEYGIKLVWFLAVAAESRHTTGTVRKLWWLRVDMRP
ncbi:hypothetical protein WN48_07968 [Eufriesea mexicana]|uniref:Uncharacterized protein n=1 Tax=Eufriesea mexicana TaxID=516756 RepID=A0A310SJL3_9HYME|nr:hypothetical protein WN48_07968 [Eufriesea mexicana]